MKISTLHKWLLSLIVLLMLGVQRLFSEELLGYFTQQFIVVLIAVLVWFLLLQSKNRDLHRDMRFLNHYLLPYIVILFVMGFVSMATYGYSLEMLAKHVLIPYLSPLTSYGILYIFYKDQTPVPFLSLVTTFVFIMLGLRFFSWSMYHFNQIVFFPRLLFQYEGWVRDGFQRVEAGMLFGIALSYATVQSMQRTLRGNTYKILILFMLAFLMLVTRVRFQALLSVVAVASAYIFQETKTKRGFLIRIFVFGAAGLFLLFSTEWVERLVSLFSVQGQYGQSALVRFQGLERYFTLMQQQQAYFGLGFLLRGNAIVESMMARNQWSIYYLDDLGMLGTVIQLGVLTIVTHGFLFMKAIQVVVKSRRVKDQSYFAFLLCLTVYMIGSNVSLNMFDSQRIFDVPFYLAIYSFMDSYLGNPLHWQSKEIGKEGYDRKITG